MTTIQEEDELFGASLSMDFYPASPTSPNNRPWQSPSSPPQRPSPADARATGGAPSNHNRQRLSQGNNSRAANNDRYREPYELLDDVPPASIPNNIARGNITPPDVSHGPRYPVEELYPTVDDNGNGNDSGYGNAAPRPYPPRSTRSHRASYSPRSEALKSRYPIDDAGSFSSREGDSRGSRYSEKDVSITESRSDSEISEYRPMNEDEDYYARQESEEGGDGSDEGSGGGGRFRYEYDNNASAYSSSRNSDDYDMDRRSGRGGSKPVGMARGGASVSSFDRLYEDEIMEMEVDSPRSTYSSKARGGRSSPGISKSRGTTPGGGSPMSEASSNVEDVTPGQDPKWANVKVDVKAPTPLRSNLQGLRARPGSPFQRTVVSPTHSPSVASPKHINTSSPDATPSEVSPGGAPDMPPTPPMVHRTKRGSDIFRTHGTNSHLSSKSGGITGVPSGDSKEESNAVPSVPSSDSAIQHLASFQKAKGLGLPISSPVSPRYGSSQSPKRSPLSPSSSPLESSPENSPLSTYSSKEKQITRTIVARRKQRVRKEDPPDEDFGYHAQSENAREPEGYRQHGLFPDIDLWGGDNVGKNEVKFFPHVPPAAANAAAANNGRTQQIMNQGASRYYEPESYISTNATGDPAGDHYRNGQRENTTDKNRYYEIDDNAMEYKSIHDNGDYNEEGANDDYDYHEVDSAMDMSYGKNSSPAKKEKEAIGFKSNNGLVQQDYYYQTTKKNEIIDDMIMVDNEDSSSSSSSSSSEDNIYGGGTTGDGVSLISEDTEIRALARQHDQQQIQKQKKTRLQQQQQQQQRQQKTPKPTKKKSKKSPSHYEVKQKDSMESDIKIDFSPAHEDKKVSPSNEKQQAHPYTDIKRNDSMEKDMSLDFDAMFPSQVKQVSSKEVPQVQVQDRRDDRMTSFQSDAVMSPPKIQRRPFSFDYPEEVEHNNGEDGIYKVPEYDDDNYVVGKSNDYVRSRSIVSDTNYSSEEDDEEDDGDDDDDESEASDDPTIFPSKAISQMNLSRYHEDDDMHESEDLVEQACHHLSRGRNDEALNILTEALQIAQGNVDTAKQKMDNFYFQKKRSQRNGSRVPNHDEDETEDCLDSNLRNFASEVAHVLNNIGVVHELKGKYQRAMDSFREALDVYRNMCHRYENAGDGDVDRTVSNIMQMGIAMRSHDKRRELHHEAEEMAAQTKHWSRSDNPSLCTQLRMEHLNILMCVLDLETESLGQHHPAVGLTLLKKGDLHLEMMHVDMAIKDTRDAVSILRKGLGAIHPEVGLALVRLGDLFNYHVGHYGGGWDDASDNKSVALSLYQEALVPLKESFGKVNPHLGLAHNGIGILYSSRGELKHALASFYDALASYGVRSREDTEASDKNRSQSSRPDVFFVWVNVGGLHMERKEWQLALRSYLKAHSAFRCLDDEEKTYLQTIGPRSLMRHALTLSKGSASFDDNDTLLASVLQNVGKAQSMLHQYGKSIETLEEALRIHHVVAMRGASGKQGMARSSSSQDVARLLENLGEVQMISGDLTSAFSRYVESLNLLRANKHVNESSIEVALVLGAIGQVHQKKGEYAEARVVLKECMRMFEKNGVPPNNRRINEFRSCLVDSELAMMQNSTSTLAGQRREISSVPYEDKALAVDEIADGYRNSGDYSGAIWFYSEALAIRRRRLEKRKDSSEIVDVGRTLSNIAQLRRERREFEAAKILFDEAKQLYTSVGLSVGHPFYRDLAQEIEVMRKM